MAIYPPLGGAVLALTNLGRGRWAAPGAWIAVWIGFWLPLAAATLLTGRFDAFAFVGAQTILGLGAGLLVHAGRSDIQTGILVGTAVLGALMLCVQLASGTLWNTRADDRTELYLLRKLWSGSEIVAGARTRTWDISGDPSSLTLRFSARAREGSARWSWLANTGASVRPAGDEASDHARIDFAAGSDPYVQRLAEFPAPVAGRTFGVEMELRSDRPLAASGCRGVWLQVWGEGGGASCRPVAVDDEWRRVTHEWTVPPEATSSTVRVVLNDFDGHTLGVRGVRFYERVEGAALEVSPLRPAGAFMTLDLAGGGGDEDATLGFLPTEAWRRYDLPVAAPPDVREATARLRLGGDLAVELRDVEIVGDGRSVPRLVPIRQALWFDHPNLLAYGIAALGVAGVAAASSLRRGAALAAAVLPALLFSGGRAALLVAAAGMALLLWLRVPRGANRLLWASVIGAPLLMIAATVGASLAGVSSLQRYVPFNAGELTARTEIWSEGLRAIGSYPLRGLDGAGSDFATFWSERRPGARVERVQHAHNLWLSWGARFGLPGLVSTLWLTVGCLVLAWRRAGVRGGLALATIMSMNLFDTVLFSPMVLFAVALGANLPSERS